MSFPFISMHTSELARPGKNGRTGDRQKKRKRVEQGACIYYLCQLDGVGRWHIVILLFMLVRPTSVLSRIVEKTAKRMNIPLYNFRYSYF